MIAGERSGDLHGANLIRSLRKLDKEAVIDCWGGNDMEAAGGNLLKHYDEMAVMGFQEVVFKLRRFLKLLEKCQQDIIKTKPDAIILIDFAGFSMRIARFARQKDLQVIYYISPKIWAWNQKRVFKIKRNVDHMLCVLPFEKGFYQKYDYPVDYVGNPLVRNVREFKASKKFLSANSLKAGKIIAVLPGSRRQEIEAMLEVMLAVADSMKQFQFVIAGLSSFKILYELRTAKKENVHVIYDRTYDLLSHATAAIVTSGTATLETALFEVPQVVVYRTSPISYLIAKSLVKVSYISLVNLIAEKEVAKELIQSQFSSENIQVELKKLIEDGQSRERQIAGYRKVKELLGEDDASEIAANLILKYVREAD